MEWSQVTAVGAAVVSLVTAATVVFRAYRNLNQHLEARFASKAEFEALRASVAKLRDAAPDRVEVGAVYLSEKDDKDYTLNAGEGEREMRRHVGFAQAYGKSPRVLVSLSRVNVNVAGDPALKVHVWADQVTAAGFDLVVQLRHKTLLHSVEVNWLAIG